MDIGLLQTCTPIWSWFATAWVFPYKETFLTSPISMVALEGCQASRHQNLYAVLSPYHLPYVKKKLSQLAKRMPLRNMTLNLLGCVRLNSLGVPIGDAMGDSNASGSAVASPQTALDSPSPVAVVMRRRRAKCSANQKRRAGSGHARHNQTLEHGEGKVSENSGGRIIAWK